MTHPLDRGKLFVSGEDLRAADEAIDVETGALRRYAVATLWAAAGLVVTWLSTGPLQTALFMFQFAAVAGSAVQGGFGPGLWTAVLSGAGFYLAFQAPGIESAEAWRLVSFALVSLLFASFAARLRGALAAERVARRRAESARRDAEVAEARARAIGALQERLVAVVSHDLRNPLGAITMSAAALERAATGEGRHERQLARIKQSAGRMQALVEDLLDYARARDGAPGIPVRRVPAQLGDVCRRAIEEIRAVHPHRHVELTVRGRDAAELDPDRVEQIVGNLVGNALKHGSADGPVHVLVEEEPAGSLRLEVRNEGPPIPAELMPALFEPFTSGDAPGSVGLGLFIVREIAVAHGGEVRASSDERGTRFAVTFPREPGARVA